MQPQLRKSFILSVPLYCQHFLIGIFCSVDEIEEFRSRLRCKSGLVVVGGADDHLRVSHFLKIKCAITQSIADRCITVSIASVMERLREKGCVIILVYFAE